MSRPLLLIVTGLPATGKTRLAKKVASDNDWPLLAKDSIKEWLFTRLGSGDALWSRQLSDASFRIQFALAQDILAASPVLVLEGNFRPGQHEPALRALIAGCEREPRCVQLLCRVDEIERRRRLDARKADPLRHPGHGDALLRDAERLSDDFLDLPGERLLHDSAEAAGDDVLSRLNQLLRSSTPE